MSISITYRCGHVQTVGPDFDQPICPTCQERTVANVQAPAPRFRGVAIGPSCVSAPVGGTVDLAPGGPLRLPKGT